MVRFRILNMSCGGCAKGVTATLREAAAEMSLRIDLDRREVEVDAEANDAARLGQALMAAGWKAELVAS
ncbi:heavy-metal-associated domain-containing protein [Falsiroseomonas sp.]|uniref:heavy-metal-associated domain-containing protein n=1 Tax=unclassified Falsiroseomonas TaxID=2870720 RepID=UPI0027225DF9|nr:heavy-metal-associated domain-containing protein [Falsiroseomonas sp.]MDO9501420.1 heavy-metal-associated domain-containing protein [Falsiroseomonas sp.]